MNDKELPDDCCPAEVHELPAHTTASVSAEVTGYKPLRVQVTVANGMVSIETPGLHGEDEFYFNSLFSSNKIDTYGLQANHENPEWPELRAQLVKVADAMIRAHKIYNSGL